MKMSIYQISDYKNMCKKGEKMNREEFLSACGECEVGYRAPLLDFYRNYADIVDKIYDKYALLDGDNQNKMLVERLKSWLEQRAYSGIVSTINTLDENSEQKVLGFFHLYDYILKSTDDDYELIDQLFFVPGRFEREFQQLNFSYKNASLLKNDIYEISVLGRR